MRVFGLTGGIASGKSTVAARFRARGVPVVDADALAREVVAPGSEGLAALVEAFGSAIVDDAGALDRKALAALVFTDDEKRRKLNAITHPRIAQASAARMQSYGAQGEPLVCYEAALLVENGLTEAFRPLVVVAAPEAIQVARTCARDRCTEDEARARIAAQMPLEQKIAKADFVVWNTGSLAELAAAADETLAKVCAATGVDASRYPAVPVDASPVDASPADTASSA